MINDFIYTDTHQLNLDWIIEQTKEARNTQQQILDQLPEITAEALEEMAEQGGIPMQDPQARIASNYAQLNGKKVIVLGDSLTIGSGVARDHTWVELLAQTYGCTCYNYGISGSKISNGGDAASSNDMVTRITGILAAHDTCDFFVLMGGANDKNSNVPIGRYDDTATTTFIGAVKSIINKVKSKYGSTCKVYTMTTYHRYDTFNTAGMGEYDYVQGMITASSFFGVPCFNNYNDCGITLAPTGYTPEPYAWADINSVDASVPSHHFSPAAYAYLMPIYANFLCAGYVANVQTPYKYYYDADNNRRWLKWVEPNGLTKVTCAASFTNVALPTTYATNIHCSSTIQIDIPEGFKIKRIFSEALSAWGNGISTAFRNTSAENGYFKITLIRLGSDSAATLGWTGLVFLTWEGFDN